MKAITKKKSSKEKTNKVLAILTICTLCITAIIIGQFIVLDHSINQTLQDGTVINGLNLSGVTRKEATHLLITDFNKKADEFSLTINDDEKNWTFTKEDFSVNSDIHTILEASQNKNELLNNQDAQIEFIEQYHKSGGAINVAFNYMFVGLDEEIEKIVNEVEEPATNSQITFTPKEKKLFNISDGKNGKRVDLNKLYQDINEQFLTSNNINVSLEYIEETPTITKEYNEKLTQKISSFSTNVADSTGGRKHNVKLALEQFDGYILNPGEEVSFNEKIGAQTLENGYQTATIIYNGEFTDGIGGGICQASTTLYNALLLGGVEITEVHRHTLPVKYVPLGLDAMVSEYTSDLKFKNISNYPIYIHTFADSQSVGVELFSYPPQYQYKTRSETLEVIKADDEIRVDKEGKYTNKVLFNGEYFRVKYPKDGYEAKVYLQTYLDGDLIEEKEIRHETYLPQRGLVIEGGQELPAGMTPIDSGVEIITNA